MTLENNRDRTQCPSYKRDIVSYPSAVAVENEKVPSVDNLSSKPATAFNFIEYIKKFDNPSYKIKPIEYFKNAIDKKFVPTEPFSIEFEKNFVELLQKVNQFRNLYGKKMVTSSGFRSVEYNKIIGGSKNSGHCLLKAWDFIDKNAEIKRFAMHNNNHTLLECKLYMEHPSVTPTWCHLDIKNRKNIIFYP